MDDLRATLQRVTDAWLNGEHPDEGDLARVERARLVEWTGDEALVVSLTDAGRSLSALPEGERV